MTDNLQSSMSNHVHQKYELDVMIALLDPAAYDCRLKIADIRRIMDASCDMGAITLYQWRTMMETLGTIQAKCAAVDPNAGWNLPKPVAQ